MTYQAWVCALWYRYNLIERIKREAEFLNLSATDILDWIILCCENILGFWQPPWPLLIRCRQHPPLSCDDQICFQTMQNVPWGQVPTISILKAILLRIMVEIFWGVFPAWVHDPFLLLLLTILCMHAVTPKSMNQPDWTSDSTQVSASFLWEFETRTQGLRTTWVLQGDKTLTQIQKMQADV